MIYDVVSSLFRYKMNSSYKDITVDSNALSKYVAKTTLLKLYYLFSVIYISIILLYKYVCVLFILCHFLRTSQYDSYFFALI